MPQTAGSSPVPARLVLEGVPRVGFYPKQSVSAPEDHCLTACIRSCLEYLGDDLGESWLMRHSEDWHALHIFLMGASGNAFSFSWRPGSWGDQTAWTWEFIGEDPLEPIHRAFEAAGYGCEILLRAKHAASLGLPGGVDDEAVYRERIVESLRADRPAIALGLHGPPAPCVIAGYDDGGETLLGWSFHQDEAEGLETEEPGYFRKPAWFADLQGLILLGDPRERAPRAAVYRDALANALRKLRTTSVRGVPAAQEAYAAWRGDLADEGILLALGSALREKVLESHDGAGGHIAEARAWGHIFLLAAAEVLSEARSELSEASCRFEAIHDLVWRLWQTLPHGDLQARVARIARPEVREDLRRIVAYFRLQDARAAAHIERALLRAGVSPDELPAASPEEEELVRAAEARIAAGLGEPECFGRQGTDGAWVRDVPPLAASPADGFAAALAAALAPTRRPCPESEIAEWLAAVPPSAGIAARAAAVSAASGLALRVEGAGTLDAAERERLGTDAFLALNEALPVVVGYEGGFAVAYGYHCWSGSLFLRVAGREETLRVPPSDPALTGPFVFLG